MEITVYNQNFGLVKDVRSIDLPEGRSVIQFMDVAAQIDPTSVHFKSLTDPTGVEILEQNYQFDLVDRAKLMQKYLGKEIRITRYDQDGQPVETQEGVLLGAEGGRPGVVRIGDEIVLDPQGTVILPKLPEGLIVRPTLVWDLATAKAGKHQVELSYMTTGLTWAADYVAVVNEDDTKADLNGWVTLTNMSGARYPDATLKLIAGDVRRVAPMPPPAPEAPMAMPMEAGMGGGGFQEKAFFEYHMYTLQRPATIAENETKQVTLLSAPGATIKKVYVLDPAVAPVAPSLGGPGDKRKVQVKIEVANKEESGLGMPLPKGKVRVYKADTDGSLQFVGEDLIDHTPKDETVRLHIGDAFDLVGERKVMDHRQLGDRAQQEKIQFSLRNHKEKDTVEITAVEHLWGEWTIENETTPFVKKDAQTAEFTVTVEPGQEKTIEFTVTTRW
ncbi:MAG TPA: DUF4139 domain-containing protein [Armatimonadota bacterium]|nr:DUF4139 domain-containing protein [Armatimonadota bacterium]